jgi:hypothetical protein
MEQNKSEKVAMIENSFRMAVIFPRHSFPLRELRI